MSTNTSDLAARLRTIAALSELAKDDFADGALDHVVPLETLAADALQQQAERITAQDAKCRLYEAALDKADREVEALKRELDGLRAARIAYASEFPLDAEGEPDTGNIHANIRALKRNAERYQWLRDNSLGQFEHPIVTTQQRTEFGMRYVGPLCGKALDKAIDIALSQSTEGRNHD